MSCTSSVGPIQETLVATSTTLLYRWGPWELAIGVTHMKSVIKRRNTTAFQTQPAIQVAPVRTDKPNAPTVFGSLVSGNGETCSTVIDISSYTAGAYWVRVGVAYSATSATVGQSDVTFQASLTRCGKSLGVFLRSPTTYSTTHAAEPLTVWLPALDVEFLKAAIVVTGLIGNFRCRLTYRTAETSPEVPGAWTTDFGTEYSADGEYPLSDTQLANLSGVMWVQIGLEVYLSTGSALGHANVNVALSGRR